MQETVVSSILGASVGLAGILLVFVGFIFTRSEGFEVVTRTRRYQIIARVGLVPFAVAIGCAWVCLEWFLGPTALLYSFALWSFQGCLVLTALYGIAALLFYI